MQTVLSCVSHLLLSPLPQHAGHAGCAVFCVLSAPLDPPPPPLFSLSSTPTPYHMGHAGCAVLGETGVPAFSAGPRATVCHIPQQLRQALRQLLHLEPSADWWLGFSTPPQAAGNSSACESPSGFACSGCGPGQTCRHQGIYTFLK